MWNEDFEKFQLGVMAELKASGGNTRILHLTCHPTMAKLDKATDELAPSVLPVPTMMDEAAMALLVTGRATDGDDDLDLTPNVPLPTLSVAIQLSLPDSIIDKTPYLKSTFSHDEAQATIDFPSLKLLNAFRTTLIYLLEKSEKEQVDVSEDPFSLHATSCLLGCENLAQQCEQILFDIARGDITAHGFTSFTSQFVKPCRTAKQFGRAEFLLRLACLYVSRFDALATSSVDDAKKRFVDLFGVSCMQQYETLHTLLFLPVVATHHPSSPPVLGGFPHLVQFNLERIVNTQGVTFLLRHALFDDGGGVVLAARKRESAGFDISTSPTTFTHGDVEYCARVSMDIFGTVFTVFDWMVKDGIGFPRMQVGVITYVQNVLGEVPNSFTVSLPNRVKLTCIRPRWNDRVGAHTLDFKGRAKIPSKKNFMLMTVDSTDVQPTLLFGKISKHVFALDFVAPCSPVMAFAIALSAFESKLLVT